MVTTETEGSTSTDTNGTATGAKGSLKIRDILRAAASLIRQHGYHGTSMQDIAVRLGIRKSSLYHHVRTKQELLFLVLDEAIESVAVGLEPIVSSKQLLPSEKLRLAIANHISQIIEHQESVGVLLRERSSLDPEYAKAYLPKRKRYEMAFRDIIRDGIREGEFRPVDPSLTTLAILGMFNWMVQWYSPEGNCTPKEIADLFTDLVMHMLRK